MIININYIFNETNDSPIEYGMTSISIDLEEYNEITSTVEKEKKFCEEISKDIKSKTGFYSVKIMNLS